MVTVDAGGALGRRFKLLRANYNLLDNVTAMHGGGNHNGISVTDMSTHSTFSNRQVYNNTGIGIATFGNANTFLNGS